MNLYYVNLAFFFLLNGIFSSFRIVRYFEECFCTYIASKWGPNKHWKKLIYTALTKQTNNKFKKHHKKYIRVWNDMGVSK